MPRPSPDGVFHLQACVHLKEVELLGLRVIKELHRACVGVADGFSEAHGGVAEGGASLAEGWARGFPR